MYDFFYLLELSFFPSMIYEWNNFCYNTIHSNVTQMYAQLIFKGFACDVTYCIYIVMKMFFIVLVMSKCN